MKIPENVVTPLAKICLQSEVEPGLFGQPAQKFSLCCGKSNLFKSPILITAAACRRTSAAFPEQKLIFTNKKKKVWRDLRDFNFLFDLNWRKTAKTKSFSSLHLRPQQKRREKHWKASHFPRSAEPRERKQLPLPSSVFHSRSTWTDRIFSYNPYSQQSWGQKGK